MSRVTDSLHAASNIPFPEFNAAIIEGVFNTVLEVNIRQTEEYIKLVKEVSQSLSSYINDTKNEVEPIEMIEFLNSLPPIHYETGTNNDKADLAGLLAEELEKSKGNPADTPGQDVQQVTAAALNTLNQKLNIPDLVEAGAGAVVDITGAISKAAEDSNFATLIGAVTKDGMTAYDPVKFESAIAANANAVSAAEISMLKIYDAVAANVAGNKYALLQEMVKLGVVRIVVQNGMIETAMTFESVTTEIHETSSEIKDTEREKVKFKRTRSRSLLQRLMKGKDRAKEKTKSRSVNVSTYKSRHLNSQTERGTLMGRSIIHWSTDYLPVREA